jgi:hypothetical protein
MQNSDRDARKPRSTPGISTADGSATPSAAGEQPLGENAPALLAAEHWSLLAARSLIWSEAQSRASVFLTLLSASIIALALVADATGFGAETTTLALALLPVVFLVGIAAYARLVQINAEEFRLVLAMNRLRRAYLTLEPGLERYLTTGHHDDQQGVFVTYMVDGPTTRRAMWVYFVVNTPSIVATVDAALATAMVVLGLQAAGASQAVSVAGGVALFWLQRQTLRPFRYQTPRFPTPPDQP